MATRTKRTKVATANKAAAVSKTAPTSGVDEARAERDESRRDSYFAACELFEQGCRIRATARRLYLDPTSLAALNLSGSAIVGELLEMVGDVVRLAGKVIDPMGDYDDQTVDEVPDDEELFAVVSGAGSAALVAEESVRLVAAQLRRSAEDTSVKAFFDDIRDDGQWYPGTKAAARAGSDRLRPPLKSYELL